MTWTEFAAQQGAVNGTTIAFTKPVGWSAGAWAYMRLRSQGDMTPVVAPNSRWVVLDSVSTNWDAYLIGDGTEVDADFQPTWASQNVSGGLVGGISDLGVAALDAFVKTTGGGGTSHIANEVVTSIDDTILVGSFGGTGGGSVNSWTPPTGMTEKVDVQQNSRPTIELVTELLPLAGPTGTREATSSAALTAGSGRYTLAAFYAVVEPPPPPEPTPSQEELIANALAGRTSGVLTRYRASWLNPDFTFRKDISKAILDVWVTGDNTRQVFRDGRVNINPEELPAQFDHLTDYITISMELFEPVTEVWFSFPLGTFVLDDPEEEYWSNTNTQWSIDMADPGIKLTTTRLGGTVTFPAGTNYVTAIEQLLDHFGFQHAIDPTAMTLPTPATWPWQTYYATALRELCDGISYTYPLADKNCVFRSEECRDPDNEEIAVTYTTLAEPRMILADVWRRSLSLSHGEYINRAIVSCEDPARPPITVQSLNNDPTSPVSRASIGSLRSTTFRVDRAYDEDVLMHFAECRVREGAARAYNGQLPTFVDPRRDIRETYILNIEDVEVGTKWRVQSWTFNARAGARMDHYLGRVQPIAVITTTEDVGEPDF